MIYTPVSQHTLKAPAGGARAIAIRAPSAAVNYNATAVALSRDVARLRALGSVAIQRLFWPLAAVTAGLYIYDYLSDQVTMVDLPREPVPGSRVIPGYHFVRVYSCVWSPPAKDNHVQWAAGDIVRDKLLLPLTSGPGNANRAPSGPCDGDGVGWVYGTSAVAVPQQPIVPSGWHIAPSVGDEYVLERLEFHGWQVNNRIDWRLWSRNNLWQRDAGSPAVLPELIDLPPSWRPAPPLTIPLPEPIARPAFPAIPAARAGRRYTSRTLPKVNLNVPAVAFDISDTFRVYPDWEQPPARNVRERKFRGKDALSRLGSLALWTYEAVDDWADWVDIVTRNNRSAPDEVRDGSLAVQLEWWSQNSLSIVNGDIDWANVAWGMLQWWIDETIQGRYVGAIQSKAARQLAIDEYFRLGPTAGQTAVRQPGGTIGTQLTDWARSLLSDDPS